MEAILPTVINNLTYKPVLAVPSTVSYGIGSGGIVSIQSILTSDSPGLAIFNIGNIYGAANFANTIGRYLATRKQTYNIELDKLHFKPLYDNNIIFNEKRDKISFQYKLSDYANSIKRNIPLLNINDKDCLQLKNFYDKYPECILRNNATLLSDFENNIKKIIDIKLPNSSKNIEAIPKNNILDIKITQHNIDSRRMYFDTSKPVLVIYGGISDAKYVDEYKQYLEINGIIVHTIQLDINHIVLHTNNINIIKNNYNLCIVIAGSNGTLSNIVGGFFNKTNVPVIAIPVTTYSSNIDISTHTLASMLNNCVGGIAVVPINNIYSAACLTLSILCILTISKK